VVGERSEKRPGPRSCAARADEHCAVFSCEEHAFYMATPSIVRLNLPSSAKKALFARLLANDPPSNSSIDMQRTRSELYSSAPAFALVDVRPASHPDHARSTTNWHTATMADAGIVMEVQDFLKHALTEHRIWLLDAGAYLHDCTERLLILPQFYLY
jgi:hypothetical protein